MMDNLSQIKQQPKIKPLLQEKVIENYFISHRRYLQLGEKSRKIISMIERGTLSIQSETPFPHSKNKSTINHDDNQKRRVNASFRLRTQPHERQSRKLGLSPTSKHNQTLSKKNKRFLESLVKKYEIFQSEIESLSPEEETQKILVQLYQRIEYYRDILKISHRRMPVSWNEEQFLDQSEYNLSLSFQMQNDLGWIKSQAYKYHCSLYRKDKFYEDLGQLKRRVELQNLKSETSDMKRQTGSSGIKLQRNIFRALKVETETNKLRERRKKGEDYLKFSKLVGVQSSQIYKRQKGNVKFIKQVIHHFWKPDNPQTILRNPKNAQSSLS